MELYDLAAMTMVNLPLVVDNDGDNEELMIMPELVLNDNDSGGTSTADGIGHGVGHNDHVRNQLMMEYYARYLDNIQDTDEYAFSPQFDSFLRVALFRRDISQDLYTKLTGTQCTQITNEERLQLRKSRDAIFGFTACDIYSGINHRRREKRILKLKQSFKQARPQLAHFQLRHVACSTSQNDIFYSENDNVVRLNPQNGQTTTLIKSDESCSCGRTSALAANKQMVVVGGIQGQYAIKGLTTDTLIQGQLSFDVNAITNHISVYDSDKILIASNDCVVRQLDATTNKVFATHEYQYPINCTAYNPSNPDQWLMVGDDMDSHLVDLRCPTTSRIRLCGHYDFGFACAWSPQTQYVATGNQDGTCRVYDLRFPSSDALHVLPTQLNGAVRSLQYDQTGNYLAMSEPIDYVQVFDTRNQYNQCQTIDTFGQIAGISWTPGVRSAQNLAVALCDNMVGGIDLYQFDSESYIPDYLI